MTIDLCRYDLRIKNIVSNDRMYIIILFMLGGVIM